MSIWDFFTFILGIALFLFGINLMGDTLKKSAGHRLKTFFNHFSAGSWKGLLFGMVVTAIIQSSTATTVMVVGLVNSGTMLLSQSVGVIMGANVGTAVTSWLTAFSGLNDSDVTGSFLQWFSPSSFTPFVALFGVILYMTGKNDRKKNTGMILLGFSVLMVGMETMSDAVSELSRNEAFCSLLLLFENPLLGVLAGMVLTAVVQSSSASIGILQSFTTTGAITFGNAVPIIMGQNIGTCVTAILASVGANRNAKRVSLLHTLFNVIGSGICLLLFYLLKNTIFLPIWSKSLTTWGIAAIHTLFNLLTAVILFPFSKRLEHLTIVMIKEKQEENNSLELLETRLLATPSIAVERSYTAVLDMAEHAAQAIYDSCELITEEYSDDKAERIREHEIATDHCEDKLGNYLMKIAEGDVLDKDERKAIALLHMLSDWERIADHAVHLTESAEEIKAKQIRFPLEEKKDIKQLTDAVCEITSLSFGALRENSSEKAEWVEPLKIVVGNLKKEIKNRHIVRVQKGIGTMEQGFVLNDILTDLMRIADHCSNIAGCLMEHANGSGMALHRSLQAYRMNREVFESRERLYAKKYQLTGDL